MNRPGPLVAALAATCAILLSLLCVTAAALLGLVRATSDIRAGLQDFDARLTLLSRQSQASAAEASARLSELSQVMRRDIGAAGRATRADMSRIRDGLAGRLDEVTRKMSDVTAASRQVASGVAPADGRAGEEEELPLPEADLSAVRQAREAAALFESGRYDQARIAYSRLLAIKPGDSTARLYHAVSLFRVNPGDSTQHARIEKEMRAVLERDPLDVLALETLSALEVEQGRWAEGFDHLRSLAALRPRDPGLQKTLGLCSLKSGDPARARRFYHAAAELAPADVGALSLLGDCEWILGNAEDARASWNRALTLLNPASAPGSRAAAELRTKLARAAEGETTP